MRLKDEHKENVDNFTFEVKCKTASLKAVWPALRLEEKFNFEASVHIQIGFYSKEREDRNKLVWKLQESSFTATKANNNTQLAFHWIGK